MNLPALQSVELISRLVSALTVYFEVVSGNKYLLEFAHSRAEGAVESIVMGRLSAQCTTRLSEHGVLLQQTVPLRDRQAEVIPTWDMMRSLNKTADKKTREAVSWPHAAVNIQGLDRGEDVM